MWDNRQTMHRVRRYDQSQPRDMRRATVAGTEPTVAAAGGGVAAALAHVRHRRAKRGPDPVLRDGS